MGRSQELGVDSLGRVTEAKRREMSIVFLSEREEVHANSRERYTRN